MTDNFNLKIGDWVKIKYPYDNAILNNKVGMIKNIYKGETSEKDILEVMIKVNDIDEVISINKEYVSSRHLVGFEQRITDILQRIEMVLKMPLQVFHIRTILIRSGILQLVKELMNHKC